MKNALSIILFVFASSAAASTITFETINAADFGRYGTTGSNWLINSNLGTGYTQVNATTSITYRNWITFDVLDYIGLDIKSATLEIFNPAGNATSVPFIWSDVLTADSAGSGAPIPPSLGEGNEDIANNLVYNDLGNGILYSSGTATAGSVDVYNFFDAIGAIQSSTKMFTIGGSIDDDLFILGQNLTAYDISNGSVQLKLGIQSVTPIPVPAAVWLFGSGLLALAGFAKRKKG